MSTAWIIAAREIRERSRLFLVAAALAILPFVALGIPGMHTGHGSAIRAIGATLAVNYAFAIALAMGASTIGRDLSEKRLSFYFSKPVSASALWLGKAGASVVIALLSALIVALPATLLTSASRSTWAPDVPTVALFTFVVSVALFLGAHALSTMTRSRSILLLLDFLLAVAALGVVALILRPILLAAGREVSTILAVSLGAGLLLILAVAPVWQLARGRTDVRRSHAALSQFLWTAVAVLLLLCAVFTFWLRAVAPADLVEVRMIDQAPAVGWAMVTGVAAHRGDVHSTFLMNAKTGQHSRLAAPPWSSVCWSKDGRVAVWMRPVGFVRIQEFELHMWEAATGEVRATGILAPSWSSIALSDDGSRVAVTKGQVLSVFDLENRRHLVSVPIENGSRAHLFFTSRDRVRFLQYDSARRNSSDRVRTSELDIVKRSLTLTGQREISGGSRPISYSADGSRAFARTTGEIVDGRTLATIAKIAPSASWGSAMLHDGKVAVVEKDGAGLHLRLFDRDGRMVRGFALPNVDRAYLVAETTDGKLLLSSGAGGVLVVDPVRGTLDRTSPLFSGLSLQSTIDPRLARYEAGMPLIGADTKGKVAVWKTAL